MERKQEKGASSKFEKLTNISKLFSDQHLHLFRIVIICSAHTIELIIFRNAHNGKWILSQFRIPRQHIFLGMDGIFVLCIYFRLC